MGILPEWLRRVLPEKVLVGLRKTHDAARAVPFAFGSRFERCAVRGLAIELLVTSGIEHYRAETYASKEPGTLDWLDAELREGDVLYDVGANIGLYSLYAAQRAPGCAVFAFEPEAQNFAHLCRNIHRNGLTQIVPVCVPLSDREEFARLHVTDMAAGTAFHSLHAPSTQRSDGVRSVLEQGALATSLDHMTEKLGLPAPSLLKLDVDGHELQIVKGMRSLLGSGKIRSLMVEINGEIEGESASPIPKLLTECGYVLAATSDGEAIRRGDTSRNCVFKRK
ncbi:MAG: FkbM family methyltransferase [Elusimicrobiota bacterium]